MEGCYLGCCVIKSHVKHKCFSSDLLAQKMSSGSWLVSIRTTLWYGINSEGEPLGLVKSRSGFLTAPSLGQRNAALQLCLENTHTHRAEADRLGFATGVATSAIWGTAKSLKGPLSSETVTGVG